MIDRYTKTILPHKAQSTITNQTHQLAWWNDRIGHLRLSDVTPEVPAACRDELMQCFKPGVVRIYIAPISHAFSTAVREWRWLDANPLFEACKVKRYAHLSEQHTAGVVALMNQAIFGGDV